MKKNLILLSIVSVLGMNAYAQTSTPKGGEVGPVVTPAEKANSKSLKSRDQVQSEAVKSNNMTDTTKATNPKGGEVGITGKLEPKGTSTKSREQVKDEAMRTNQNEKMPEGGKLGPLSTEEKKK